MLADEILYQALLNGDLGAFDVLYERYERPLFGFIRRQLADAPDAEDVLHEAFMALFRDRAGARQARSLRAWLFQVANHLCLNRVRARQRGDRALELDARAPALPGPNPEQVLLEGQKLEALRGAVARLPLELAALYQLRASGMSYDEMSVVLEVPLGTVKSRMHQLVRQLRVEVTQ